MILISNDFFSAIFVPDQLINEIRKYNEMFRGYEQQVRIPLFDILDNLS